MKRGAVRFAAGIVSTCFLATICAQGQSSAVRSFRQAEISPDGSRVAWVQDSVSPNGDAGGISIYVQELKPESSKPRRISASDGNIDNEDNLAWSPDSRHIAFLSDAEDHNQSQLYVTDIEKGAARKLTSITGSLADPSWSPDGKTIAFLFTENAPQANPLNAMLPETGVIANTVYEQRLALVDVVSGNLRELSPPDMYVYEYDWSPDGKNFALIAAHGAGDANWYVAQLYTLGAERGQLKPVYKPNLQIAVPRWSPDGKSIAFIEGLMSDEGVIGGDIFVVAPTGGPALDVTPDIAASPSGLYWQTPNKILFGEDLDGQVGISTVELSSGAVSQLWEGAGGLRSSIFGATDISLAADGRSSAALRNSSDHAPEVWAGPVGEWKQVTHANQAARSDWGEMKSLHWASDGMRIQGWLMYPKGYDPGRHYPMVVVAHGGPAGEEHTVWPYRFFNTYELSAHGYFVFYPNPRGSFGQGEKFTQGNVKDFGYGDFRDIMAGVDEVIKSYPVDKNRVGITGWSYGGYMTMWAVTQTNRFRAAVAGAGIANWQSYYGENDIDEWMIPYFGGSVYDDPAVYAKSAPITFIKNVKTPTLVLVGERDGECPAAQSREFWHALKTLGVETELVIYPGEGHVFNQAEHQKDAMERLISWFDHYLK
ncbi:MAG TPA: S9 family peptidase [Terriglobales bacterium]|nr:S9 family peptidase [Terriglobales bacterium]